MKIPKEATKVVEIIRRESKKPKRLPKSQYGARGIQLRFRINGKLFCPLGLCKKSKSQSPVDTIDFPYGDEVGNTEIIIFYECWDKFRIPQEAVDAVWGK